MRVAVLSDIHANLVALDAVLSTIGDVDAIWHLGDIMGYGPEPNGVVARLAAVGAVGVRGNHDVAALGGPEIELFNRDARRAMEWTRNTIDDATRTWLALLPERRIEGEFALVHGSQRDPMWEYVTSVPVARASLDRLESPYGLFGHTHVPAAYREDRGRVDQVGSGPGVATDLAGARFLLNPGSVGQPRDGDPAASYLVLDTEARRCSWHRVPYDVRPVQEAMARAGLPQPLIVRLAVGL